MFLEILASDSARESESFKLRLEFLYRPFPRVRQLHGERAGVIGSHFTPAPPVSSCFLLWLWGTSSPSGSTFSNVLCLVDFPDLQHGRGGLLSSLSLLYTSVCGRSMTSRWSGYVCTEGSLLICISSTKRKR